MFNNRNSCPRCLGEGRPIDFNTWRCTRCGFVWRKGCF